MRSRIGPSTEVSPSDKMPTRYIMRRRKKEEEEEDNRTTRKSRLSQNSENRFRIMACRKSASRDCHTSAFFNHRRSCFPAFATVTYKIYIYIVSPPNSSRFDVRRFPTDRSVSLTLTPRNARFTTRSLIFPKISTNVCRFLNKPLFATLFTI